MTRYQFNVQSNWLPVISFRPIIINVIICCKYRWRCERGNRHCTHTAPNIIVITHDLPLPTHMASTSFSGVLTACTNSTAGPTLLKVGVARGH